VRYVAPLTRISPNFTKALLAREDSRFYQHRGVDYAGILRAAWRNATLGSVREGASTLTQQLARNTYSLDADRWRRKVIEALLALRIEQHLSKDEILEAYMNRIYFGLGLYGVETASRACFGKSASELTLSESSILAGLIRSPNRFTPLGDSRKAITQRNQVLERMKQLEWITEKEQAVALEEEIPSGKRLPPVLQADYAMDAVTRDLAILLPRNVIERGGLKIYTTIDRRLQLLAQDAVGQKLAELERQPGWKHPTRESVLASAPTAGPDAVASPFVQGSLVAIDNESGGIRAIVGGRDFKESPYNRALLARRQLGSTFKPFVYAAAFDRGLMPGTLISDAELAEGEVEGAGHWTPENSDGSNGGMLPVSQGLIRSRNTMSVRVGQLAGVPVIHQLAVRAGFADVPAVPAMFLGAFEQNLKDVTGAYTTFACNGTRKQPYIIERIEDRDGQTIYKASHAELPLLRPSVSYLVTQLMREVLRSGTAASSKSLGLDIPAAGKTGTTDDYKDAWFVGFTSRLTCGVWVGMDRPERIMDHGYGSALALPIWVAFMEEAAKWKYQAVSFSEPDNLRDVTLCNTSGRLATPECTADGTSYEAKLPADLVPKGICPTHAPVYTAVPVSLPAPPAQDARPNVITRPSYTVVQRNTGANVAAATNGGRSSLTFYYESQPKVGDSTPQKNYRISPTGDGFRLEPSE